VQGSGSETNMWVCINQNSCDVTRAGFKGLASSIYATVLATMDGEEYRTESADSENGSDNSYVQVTQEEAQQLGCHVVFGPPVQILQKYLDPL